MTFLGTWVKGSATRVATWFWPMLGLLALLVYRQASDLLGRVLATGGDHAGMTAISGMHFPPFGQQPASAVTVWSAAGGTSAAVVHALLLSALVADVFFIAAYWFVFRRLIDGALGPPDDWTPPERRAVWRTLLRRILVGLVALDLLEDYLSVIVIRPAWHGGGPSRALAVVLDLASFAKWLALIALVVGLLAARAARHPAADAVALAVPARNARAGLAAAVVAPRRRSLSRLRVQLVVLVALAFIATAPIGGALDQLPDLLRHFADPAGPGEWSITWLLSLIPPAFALLLLTLAIWMTSRWALLKPYSGTVLRERTVTAARLFVVGGVGLVVAVLLVVLPLGPLKANAGILTIPGLLVVLAIGNWILVGTTKKDWPDALPQDDPDWTAREVDVLSEGAAASLPATVSVLAALPVVIAGLGLVRAFVGPALVGGGESHGPAVWLLLAGGVVTALLAGPIVSQLFEQLDDLRANEDPAHSGVLAVVVSVLTLVGCVTAAVWPREVGQAWQVNGLLTLFAAAVVLLGGWWQYRAEVHRPLYVTYRLGLGTRTPVFVLVLVVFILTGVLDRTGGYHDVRRTTAASVAPAEVDMADALKAWLQRVNECHADKPATVPLVLVAAPGGGIRATYWTALALRHLYTLEVAGQSKEQRCGHLPVFAASGVSGGALGLVVESAHDSPVENFAETAPGGPPGWLQRLGWAHARSGDVLNDLADESSLSATGAALLFRDLPRSLLGLRDPWDDRAAVLEKAWEDRDPALQAPYFTDLLPAATDQGWRPLLFLNGSEVSTGCRVVVSPARVAVPATGGLPEDCRAPVVRDGGRASGAIDAGDFVSGCKPTADLNSSSAALLAARFPLVSPSGTVRCGKRSFADLDGGATENTGLSTMLDVWQLLRPLVAQQNACAAKPAGTPSQCPPLTIRPMLVMLDNHYRSVVAAHAPKRITETNALLHAKGAKAVAVDVGVLEQQALVAFSHSDPSSIGSTPVVDYYVVAPSTRPTVSAPLGWTLSYITRHELTSQLKKIAEDTCMSPTTQVDATAQEGLTTTLRPASLACLRDELASP